MTAHGQSTLSNLTNKPSSILPASMQITARKKDQNRLPCLQLGQRSVPLDFHGGREGRKSALVCGQVFGNPTRSGEFLESSLRSWCAAQIVEAPDYFEHRRQCQLAESDSEALMRSEAKVRVKIHVPIELDSLRLWEADWIL